MKLCLIGNGAIAQYVRAALGPSDHQIVATLVRPERLRNLDEAHTNANGTEAEICIADVQQIPPDCDVVIDCAGHSALAQYGPAILAAGFDMITVSIGALADGALQTDLRQAAQAGKARLHLASGAIGALDALRAARSGRIEQIEYIGRKPPMGWKGSPAETVLDLDDIAHGPQVHFQGTARQAALLYPKNANVAAAVALSGLGFDETRVTLIADPAIAANIHEIHATGDFGELMLRLSGKALPDNPKSSALAAMSVLASLEALSQPIVF